MSEIKTLVYFDVEATGLKNSGRPRVTEMSFVAVKAKDVLELHSQIVNQFTERKAEIGSTLPQIVNKLTVCVYPMAIIRPEVSEITGLDNYNLSGQATFSKNTGELINSFLGHLPRPLCLVAHNGVQYDFPLLKAELEKVGMTLPSDTLCADSYLGLKEIFRKREEVKQSQPVKYQEMDNGATETSKIENLGEICREIERENSKTPTKSMSLRDQHSEETNLSKVLKMSRMNAIKMRHQLRSPGMLKVKKRIDFLKFECPESFSLINLHRQLLGCSPAQSHGAEADCFSLLRTTASLGMEWMTWIQGNRQLFRNCTKMWSL